MLIWIILFLVIEIITITALVEHNRGIAAFSSIVGGLVFYEFLFARGTLMSMWAFILANPWMIVGGVLCYILIGVAWSIYKYRLFLYEKKKGGATAGDNRYSPEGQKDRLITWMIYWPFSLTWFIINDPITRLYNWVFSKMKKIYEGIYTSILKEEPKVTATKMKISK